VSPVDWCLQLSIRVGWCLPWFISVGVDVSSRLMLTNICNNRLVPTNNYKENFCGFLPKEFPRKSCVPCSTINRSHMWLFSYGWWMFEKVKNCLILIHPPLSISVCSIIGIKASSFGNNPIVKGRLI